MISFKVNHDSLPIAETSNRAILVVTTDSQFDAPSKTFDTKFKLANDLAVDR